MAVMREDAVGHMTRYLLVRKSVMNLITHAAQCTSNQFRCDSGDCVSSSFRCNGRTGGCTDGSDERGCCKLMCQHHMYTSCKQMNGQ